MTTNFIKQINRFPTYVALISLFFIAGFCDSPPDDPTPTNTNGCTGVTAKVTNSAIISYSGIFKSEVFTLLSRSIPWRTPSCSNGTDLGQKPASLASDCPRDIKVIAAIDLAWAAETKWRFNDKTQAEMYAKLAREQLNQAEELCSNAPTVCATCTCSTEKVWPCPGSQPGSQIKASFTYSPSGDFVAPQKITFTNTSSNATSYKWEFGDNTTSTEANPVKTFTNANTYTVKLTATSSKGTNSTQVEIQINSAESSSFSGEIPGHVTWSNVPDNVHQALLNLKNTGSGGNIRLIDVGPDNSFIIINGDNGYTANGIPQYIFEAIKTANANNRTIKDVAITRNAGVLLWGFNGYNLSGVTADVSAKFKEYVDNAKFEMNGFTFGADNATWSMFFGNGGAWISGDQTYLDAFRASNFKIFRSELTLDNSGWIFMNKEGTQLTWRNIPSDCSAQLKTLLEISQKKILDVSFTSNNGYIIVYE